MTEYECLSMNEENDDGKFGESGSYMTESLKIDLVEDEQDRMTYFSQKYYFLHIQDDICVEKFGIQTVQSQSVIKGKESNKPLNQVSNQKHKESVLISLSNKVKILEKNFTAQQSNLRSLETISGQTNADVKKILKSLVKADESFKAGFGTDFSEQKDGQKTTLGPEFISIFNYTKRTRSIISSPPQTQKRQ